MFNKDICMEELKRCQLQWDYPDSCISMAYACDPQAQEKRDKSCQFLAEAGFLTCEFEEANQVWFRHHYDQENIRLRIYYLYGMYLCGQGRSTDAIRVIPEDVLKQDGEYCRTAALNDAYGLAARASVPGHENDFDTYLKLDREMYESLGVALAHVGFYQYELLLGHLTNLERVLAASVEPGRK